jgi:hypothetical protein
LQFLFENGAQFSILFGVSGQTLPQFENPSQSGQSENPNYPTSSLKFIPIPINPSGKATIFPSICTKSAQFYNKFFYNHLKKNE